MWRDKKLQQCKCLDDGDQFKAANCTEVSAFATNNFSVTCHCLSLLCPLSISAHTSLSLVTLSAQYLSTHVTVCHYSIRSVSQHTHHCLSLLRLLSISTHTSLSVITLSAQYLSTHTTVCHYSVRSVSQHTRHCLSLLCLLSISAHTHHCLSLLCLLSISAHTCHCLYRTS